MPVNMPDSDYEPYLVTLPQPGDPFEDITLCEISGKYDEDDPTRQTDNELFCQAITSSNISVELYPLSETSPGEFEASSFPFVDFIIFPDVNIIPGLEEESDKKSFSKEFSPNEPVVLVVREIFSGDEEWYPFRIDVTGQTHTPITGTISFP